MWVMPAAPNYFPQWRESGLNLGMPAGRSACWGNRNPTWEQECGENPLARARWRTEYLVKLMAQALACLEPTPARLARTLVALEYSDRWEASADRVWYARVSELRFRPTDSVPTVSTASRTAHWEPASAQSTQPQATA